MYFAERDKTRGAQVAALTSMLLIAQQVAGKAARDALFLSSFHASSLPLAMGVGAVLSLLAVLWLSSLMVRYAPATIMPVLFAGSAAGFALEWALAGSHPRAAALLVYFQTALLGPVMITTFWSMINERFDPHAAKRAVARVSGGGTLGGVLGGLAAWRASAFIEPLTILLFLALLNGLGVISTLVTRARRSAEPKGTELGPHGPDAEQALSPFAWLRTKPFLRNLAILVALGSAISALLDYIFSAQAAASFGKGAPLLSFFSLFWLAVSLLSFTLQLTLGRVALEKLGLAVNIAILPGIIVLGGAVGLAVPGLASGSLLRGAEAVQRNTLFRSAYELLYTPVPEVQKRATKAVIDVGFDRLGTVIGSGLALLALHSLARGHATAMLAAVVVLALATLPVTRQLHVGYVEALQQQLREGASRLERPAGENGSFAAIAPESSRSLQIEREDLIDRVELLQPGGLTALVDANAAEPPVAAAPALQGNDESRALLSAARDLLSADPASITRALSELDARDPGVSCAILLLGHPEHHVRALDALHAHAPRITGQLLDALLDPATDFVVRRRIPRALAGCSTQRAADGLLLGIADERFEVRYECGRALSKVTEVNPRIVIAPPRVVEAIEREIESSKRIAEGGAAQPDEFELDEQRALVEGLRRDRANRSLEHMFTILSLLLEREPLRMALRALHHTDDKHRGTALEYLDTVLPAEIHAIIWPYLGETAPLPHARPVQELLADLARAESQAAVDPRLPATAVAALKT